MILDGNSSHWCCFHIWLQMYWLTSRGWICWFVILWHLIDLLHEQIGPKCSQSLSWQPTLHVAWCWIWRYALTEQDVYYAKIECPVGLNLHFYFIHDRTWKRIRQIEKAKFSPLHNRYIQMWLVYSDKAQLQTHSHQYRADAKNAVDNYNTFKISIYDILYMLQLYSSG